MLTEDQLAEEKRKQKEFAEEQDKLLQDLPEEFRGFVSAYAWDQGHAYGYSEVLLHVQDLADQLKGPISQYTSRLLILKTGS